VRNVDWIVIATTMAYVLLAAFALWIGLGRKLIPPHLSGACALRALPPRPGQMVEARRRGDMQNIRLSHQESISGQLDYITPSQSDAVPTKKM
jgi:hypothetical protein